MQHFTITPAAPTALPESARPPAAISHILAKFDRDQLETLVEAAIERLDDLAGDPDFEDDTEDTECSEDEIGCGPGNWGSLGAYRDGGHDRFGPGCPLADPGEHGFRRAPTIKAISNG